MAISGRGLAIDSHVEGMAATRLSLFSTILSAHASSVKAASAPAHRHPHRPLSPRSSSSQTHASPGHRTRQQVRPRHQRYRPRHRLSTSSGFPTFARHPSRSPRIPPKPAQRIHHRPLAARRTIASRTPGQRRTLEQPPASLQTAQHFLQSQLRPIDAVS